ncbi:unnamed protein product [Pedinophyceae sp. YPF-701]|nr:unnamed protein product [Pedinophyceae sp. YPF-701]
MAKVSEGVWTASFAVPGALAPITFGCVPCVHRGPDDEGTPVDPRHSLCAPDPGTRAASSPPVTAERASNAVAPSRVRCRHCGVPVGMTTGGPSPLGCSVVSKAKDGAGVTRYSVNFALFSRVATGVNLVLVRYDPRGTGGAKVIETSLDPHVNRWGDVWHVQLDGLKDLETLYYGFRVDGDMSWEDSRCGNSACRFGESLNQ